MSRCPYSALYRLPWCPLRFVYHLSLCTKLFLGLISISSVHHEWEPKVLHLVPTDRLPCGNGRTTLLHSSTQSVNLLLSQRLSVLPCPGIMVPSASSGVTHPRVLTTCVKSPPHLTNKHCQSTSQTSSSLYQRCQPTTFQE